MQKDFNEIINQTNNTKKIIIINENTNENINENTNENINTVPTVKLGSQKLYLK